MSASSVFVMQTDDSLVALKPAKFASEMDFQRMLSRFPALLVGDQINPENPRKWVLVRREQPVATGETGAAQWAIDHLFLDQDGVPTLVEVKRQSDSRIRREVVGQMLDYAANCAIYWSTDKMKASLDLTCAGSGKTSEAVILELIAPEQNIEGFWQRVKTNLQAGRIRLLFVADLIPIELRRIVEFLNVQMDPAEVLAIELSQFTSDEGLRTIVPVVFGQTQEAVARKSGVSETTVWDDGSFFETLSNRVGPAEMEAARKIVEWMMKGRPQPRFGTGKTGSIAPDFRPVGVDFRPIYLCTDSKLYLQFGSWKGKPFFDDMTRRRALLERFMEIKGANLVDGDLEKYPSISLNTIVSSPDGVQRTLAALSWMSDQITTPS